MILETAHSSYIKLIGLNLHVGEHRIAYSNLTPDPQGAWGAPGVKIQVSPNQKTSLTKVVSHGLGMIKISSAVSASGGARKTHEAGFLELLLFSREELGGLSSITATIAATATAGVEVWLISLPSQPRC